MAKSPRIKYAKKGVNRVTYVVHRRPPPGQGGFKLPHAEAVMDVVSEAKSGDLSGVKKLKRKYDSAGYKILGLTDDGIVIVRPSGKRTSFRTRELRSAFSESKAAKSKRPSL
jgi:hypothetical protein